MCIINMEYYDVQVNSLYSVHCVTLCGTVTMTMTMTMMITMFMMMVVVVVVTQQNHGVLSL